MSFGSLLNVLVPTTVWIKYKKLQEYILNVISTETANSSLENNKRQYLVLSCRIRVVEALREYDTWAHNMINNTKCM